jgi:nucleoside-diphosphate-sugar epimerase
MHICVIGGTGHISTSIVRVLLAQGHEVSCFNRGRRGKIAPGARLVQGDRRERATFEHRLRSWRRPLHSGSVRRQSTSWQKVQ